MKKDEKPIEKEEGVDQKYDYIISDYRYGFDYRCEYHYKYGYRRHGYKYTAVDVAKLIKDEEIYRLLENRLLDKSNLEKT